MGHPCRLSLDSTWGFQQTLSPADPWVAGTQATQGNEGGWDHDWPFTGPAGGCRAPAGSAPQPSFES